MGKRLPGGGYNCTMSPEAPAGVPTSWIQRIRVPLGFLFAILFLLVARPEMSRLAPGLIVAGVGLAVRTWAAGHLRKHEGLSVRGPYRWTRNPLYLGSFLMGIGFCIAASSGLLTLLFAGLFATIYVPVMRREEAELEQAYGDPYRRYRTDVPLILPTGRSCGAIAGGSFSWTQVFRNREHQAWAGAVIISAYLSIRVIWP